MKKLYTILALSLALGSASAQTSLTTAVDFTVTDVNGNTFNLFNMLNSGKYVCIDFFFTTCGPCQQTSPYFKTTYQNYGCNSGQVYFIAMDYGDNNAQCIAYENTYLGGNSGYPVFSGQEGGGTAVCNTYGIGAYPTYILIHPNKTIIEQDMWPISSPASFDAYFSSHGLSQTPCPTGVEEVATAANVMLFPNPASGQITIADADGGRITAVRVFDMMGKTYIERKFEAALPEQQLILSELNSGVYFIEVITESSAAVLKFSKF
ncbi:MAG: T9SS type A sorting domain-containing protein [Bacteroidota bacterium]